MSKGIVFAAAVVASVASNAAARDSSPIFLPRGQMQNRTSICQDETAERYPRTGFLVSVEASPVFGSKGDTGFLAVRGADVSSIDPRGKTEDCRMSVDDLRNKSPRSGSNTACRIARGVLECLQK